MHIHEKMIKPVMETKYLTVENAARYRSIIRLFYLNFVINSQILWGDYDTVPSLAIYQLVRPENARYVTVIPYVWNGRVRSMAMDPEEKTEGAGKER